MAHMGIQGKFCKAGQEAEWEFGPSVHASMLFLCAQGSDLWTLDPKTYPTPMLRCRFRVQRSFVGRWGY